jgi:hypothetical protein
MPKLPCGGTYEGSAVSGFGKKCNNLLCEFCDKPWEYIYKARFEPESLNPRNKTKKENDENF